MGIRRPQSVCNEKRTELCYLRLFEFSRFIELLELHIKGEHKISFEIKPVLNQGPCLSTSCYHGTPLYYSDGICAKSQLTSECIYEVIISPKMPTKNYRDFCPGSLLEGRADIVGNFG